VRSHPGLFELQIYKIVFTVSHLKLAWDYCTCPVFAEVSFIQWQL